MPMRRRWRGPAIWIGLGVIAVLAYLAIQPVPVSTNGYQPPATTVATVDPAPAASVAPLPAAPLPATPAAATTVGADIPGFVPLAPLPEPAPAPAASPTRSPVMYVTATSLNLRTAPQATAEVLERLDRGRPVDVVGATEGWFEVINPASGIRGWMSAEFLSDTPPAGTSPAGAAAPAAPAAPPGLTPVPAAGATPGTVQLPALR